MPDRLKLRARDEEDLGVIAALLQDALVPMADITFLPDEKRFALVLNRFRWEAATTSVPPPIESDADAPFADEQGPCFERVHCGLCFDRVAAVRTKGIDPRARNTILELLTIRAEDGAIDLVFAGEATIRLEVEDLDCRFEDLDEAWPTRWRPRHAVGDEDGEA